jgi:hypothetical protein
MDLHLEDLVSCSSSAAYQLSDCGQVTYPFEPYIAPL